MAGQVSYNLTRFLTRVSMRNSGQDLLKTAEETAVAAGELLRKLWPEPRQIKSKGYRDFVTDADIASQELIAKSILERYPEHGFITEEDAPDLAHSGDVVWIIDPLDGTSNYSRLHPIFCVSIAAAVKQADGKLRVIAGAIFDPMRNELFSAADGFGSKLNGAPISVSETGELEASYIGLDWSRGHLRRQAILGVLDELAHQVHTIRAIGSAALALGWVANGRLDIYFNVGVGSWDVAAGSVIINEAGGSVTNYAGSRWSVSDTTCVASNGVLNRDFHEVGHLIELLGSGDS